MPHGDFSDLTAVTLFGLGIQQIFYPQCSYYSLGPLKPLLDGGFEKAGANEIALLRFSGAFMIVIALAMFQVWWDSTNSILPAIGFLSATANFALTSFWGDGGVFVPRVGYVYAAVCALGFIHLAFLRNKKDLVDVILAERAQKKK